jgi:phosphogluconate dehydratase
MDGPIGKVQDGDVIVLDANAGTLELKVDAETLAARAAAAAPAVPNTVGRSLFANARSLASSAEAGGSFLFPEPEPIDA